MADERRGARDERPEDAEGPATAGDFLRQTTRFLTVDLWHADLWRDGPTLPHLRAALLRSLRVVVLAVQRFFAHRTMFHASSLTYITILSIVPVLAVGFSMAKGLGAYERLRTQVITPFLDEYIGSAPSADAEDGGPAALRAGIDKVVEFVDRTDFSVLGIFASAAMFLTVIKLLGAVERSMNEIWGVQRSRTLVRKLSDYLTLVVVTPIGVLLVTGVTASVQNQRLLDKLREVLNFDPLLGLLAPIFTLVVIWGGFTFVYLVMPNTRVKFTSALAGGVVAGTLWQGVQVLHVKSQVGMARYEVLYAGFAAFPILLFWIYLSWVVLLFGVHVGFAHQNERSFRGFAFFETPDEAMREHVALRALVRVGQAFVRGEEPPKLTELAVRIGVPERLLNEVLERLERARLVTPSGRHDGRYLPARSLSGITVAQVLAGMRHEGGRAEAPSRGEVDELVNELLERVEADVEASVANRTLLDLVQEADRVEGTPARGRGDGEPGRAAPVS